MLNENTFTHNLLRATIKYGDPLGGKGVISANGLKMILENLSPLLYQQPEKMFDIFNHSLLAYIEKEINTNPEDFLTIKLDKDYTSTMVKNAAQDAGYTLPKIRGYYSVEYNCKTKVLKTKDFTKLILPEIIEQKLKAKAAIGKGICNITRY